LPLKLAIEKLKEKMPEVENDEVLMVGDSLSRDLLPAKKLGLNTALAKYGQNVEETGEADYELTGISDILAVIKLS